MQLKVYQSRLSQLSARFNLMVLLVCGLLFTNILLSSFVWTVYHHQIIEVTPFFGESRYFKSEHGVDGQYLSLMSENFIYSRLNVTPETVAANHKRLLQFVDSRHYAEILKQLNSEAKLIQSQKLASEFVITALSVNPNALTATITGVLKRSVGLKVLKEEQHRYQLTFQYYQGRLTILTFTQEKSHA